MQLLILKVLPVFDDEIVCIVSNQSDKKDSSHSIPNDYDFASIRSVVSLNMSILKALTFHCSDFGTLQFTVPDQHELLFAGTGEVLRTENFGKSLCGHPRWRDSSRPPTSWKHCPL